MIHCESVHQDFVRGPSHFFSLPLFVFCTERINCQFVFQDSLGGLEIQSQEKWVKAPPIEGTIVVNIGDLLQFWSGGKYKATPHR